MDFVKLLEDDTSTGDEKFFAGGRAFLVVTGDADDVNLQLKGQDGTWLDMQAVTSDSTYSLDCPPGSYRGEVVGSATALYMDLFRIPY